MVYKNFISQSVSENEDTDISETVEIPAKVLANKFGYLSGGDPINPFIGEVGAAWVRPHPGFFLWDSMQENENSEIDFSNTDEEITSQQDQQYGTLVTLWPFAEWDQLNYEDPKSCEVSENDEFLYDPSGKRGEEYIPLHRCNPNNWDKYTAWVTAVVERYDGDGIEDMPNLTVPVKYWEVMNEPDLDGSPTLDFYAQDAEAYSELLTTTYSAIKEADETAFVLISGAAGGDDRFLDFYAEVFENPEAVTSFDIGNVHCISNDGPTHDFNVGPYKEFLASLDIDKPIWITEAESIISNNVDLNASSTLLSTQNAIELGAERIFYTRYDFEVRGDLNDRPFDNNIVNKTIEGDNPTTAYQEIIESAE